MSDRIRTRWVGLALCLIGVVATLWLASSGRLSLYIHPRYIVFTVVMAVLGALLVAAALLFAPAGADHDDHEHDDEPVRPLTRRATTVGAVALVAASAVAMLALPPASLSTGSLTAGDLESASSVATEQAPSLTGGDSTTFTVKDWSALLRQGVIAADLTGLSADVVGFVAADPSGSPDVFYLARYSVTCCAVDAQPIAIPVHLPDWDGTLDEGGWVQVRGSFEDVTAGSPLTALSAESAESIDEPRDPYVF